MKAMKHTYQKTKKTQKTLQFLMTEIYKIKNNHAPPIMYHLVEFRETLSM